MDSIYKIVNLMESAGISAYQLEKETGVSNSLISQWKAHRQNPSVKNIKKIAKYFNVPWESLTADEDIEFIEPDNAINEAINKSNSMKMYFSKSMVECIEKLAQLNTIGTDKALEYMDDLIASGKYSKDKS